MAIIPFPDTNSRKNPPRIRELTSEDEVFLTTMQVIASAIKAAGYNPEAQLYGYLTTGNATYITRSGNARALIQGLRKDKIWRYIKAHALRRPS